MSIYIALGANLSTSENGAVIDAIPLAFSRALDVMQARGITVTARSSLWQSPAWPPGSAAPDYLNAVIKVQTALKADALLGALHAIEGEMGRVRTVQNAPRTLDLDLLDYKGELWETQMILPHPRMLSRGFVLVPLAEIAPKWRDPVEGREVMDWIGALAAVDVLSMSLYARRWAI